MCLHPHPAAPVPEETARVAHAVFPKGNPYLRLRDEFGVLFADEQFAPLFPTRGHPAAPPWRLAVVTLLQYAEGLSDRQAADAVRRCLDWKYLLGLELTDPGFDHSLLCEFRARLVAGSAELLLFETLLTRCREHGLLKARGKQRTDATHVLAAIRQLSRLETVGETLRATLNVLALAAPEWVREHSDPAWVQRYGHRFEEHRWPQGSADRETLALTVGADGFRLLEALYAPTAPRWLRALPAVDLLRHVWLQQYYREETPAGWHLRWRTPAELPPTPERVLSPYDPDARWGQKRTTEWIGFSTHVSETCDAQTPLLITDVQTTVAPTADSDVLPAIQADLAQRDLLPAVQVADPGYITGAEVLRSQQEYQVELLGPDQEDTSWQARAGQGFAARDFAVDWEHQRVRCPGGKESVGWRERHDHGRPVIKVHFARRDCHACPHRSACTRAAEAGRQLTLPPEATYRTLQQIRERSHTPEFARAYAARAGVEGTISQGVRRCGLHRARYRGWPKVHLGNLLTAAALNLVRVGAWLLDPLRARTQQSAFARLMASPA
jgi:transposase